MVPPLDIRFENWIEHVTFGLHCVVFRFSTGIFYGEVSQLIVYMVFGAVD